MHSNAYEAYLLWGRKSILWHYLDKIQHMGSFSVPARVFCIFYGPYVFLALLYSIHLLLSLSLSTPKSSNPSYFILIFPIMFSYFIIFNVVHSCTLVHLLFNLISADWMLVVSTFFITRTSFSYCNSHWLSELSIPFPFYIFLRI